VATTVDDWAAIEAELQRFARRSIEPRVARPEAPMAPEVLGALLAEAEALGFAGSDGAPSGLGPWEELADGEPPARTLRLLRELARANAAVALALHQRSLARATLRAHGLGSPAGRLAVAPQGWWGLGRTALARWLALDGGAAALDAEDRELLADAYAPGAARVLPIEPDIGGLVTPAFAGGGFAWQVHAAASLEIVGDAQGHGLDELRTASLRPRGSPHGTARTTAEGLARTLGAHQLGLVAIALGAAERAHALARRYAADRRQGGAPIDRHPAVLGLLGQASAAIAGAGARLEAAGARPIALARFGELLGWRAEAMVALGEAAHAAIQVFGGIGYMRDTGAEKVARDVNALRALAGTPPELLLVAAEWERLRG